MSSPPPTEDTRLGNSDVPELAPTAISAQTSDSKDTTSDAKQAHDGDALAPQLAAAKFAFDETLFGSHPVTEDTAIDDGDQDDEQTYPDAEESSLLPPPDFKPFFTLIEDSSTGEHHHPTVHYVFADDDQEIITAAALDTISDEQQGSEDERFVIVDMNADGKEVVSVSSLSPEWQNLKTKVAQAPSWGDESKAGDRGLMLRISGQETEDWSDRRRKGDVDDLLKAFDDLASRVVDAPAAETDAQVAQ